MSSSPSSWLLLLSSVRRVLPHLTELSGSNTVWVGGCCVAPLLPLESLFSLKRNYISNCWKLEVDQSRVFWSCLALSVVTRVSAIFLSLTYNLAEIWSISICKLNPTSNFNCKSIITTTTTTYQVMVMHVDVN